MDKTTELIIKYTEKKAYAEGQLDAYKGKLTDEESKSIKLIIKLFDELLIDLKQLKEA